MLHDVVRFCVVLLDFRICRPALLFGDEHAVGTHIAASITGCLLVVVASMYQHRSQHYRFLLLE